MSKLEEWLASKEARLHQFTPAEIEAEQLRQDIRELEKRSLDPSRKDEIFDNAAKVQELKAKLGVVQEYAELTSHGREVGKDMMELAKRAFAAGEVPHNSQETINKYLRHVSAIEQKEKEQRQRDREWLKQAWINTSWEGRMALVRWYGKATFYQTFMRTVPRAIARLGVKLIR